MYNFKISGSIQNLIALQEIEVYPIPASEQLVISWNGAISKNTAQQTLSVYNTVSGHAFYSEKFLGSRHVSINVSSWPPGIYLLHIRNSENGNLILNRKIVIQ